MANNSFKPNLLRYGKSVAEKACHAFASTTQVGLTQALGLSGHMPAYPSEPELISALDRSDELVRLCASGQLSFSDFCGSYDNFYWSHALDGHESDQAGLTVLAKYAARIAPHQTVAETILAKLCSDADAVKEPYRLAGRFGSIEAAARLKIVAAGLPRGEA